MNEDTKAQLKSSGALVAVIAAVTTGGVFISQRLINPPAPTVTLLWDTGDTSPGIVTEVWASTDLTNWTLRTNVAGTNRVTLPRDKPQEFFKIRNRLDSTTNGIFSDWARKTTR